LAWAFSASAISYGLASIFTGGMQLWAGTTGQHAVEQDEQSSLALGFASSPTTMALGAAGLVLDGPSGFENGVSRGQTVDMAHGATTATAGAIGLFGKLPSLRPGAFDVPAKPTVYSVAFEHELSPAEFGLSRDRHFSIAGKALNAERAVNPELAELVPPAAGRNAPSGWVWQHATSEQAARAGVARPGVLQLVPDWQHTPGSAFWRILHPLKRAAGGYSQWAIPAGAPPN
jgi:hypothetical protein